MTQPNQTAPDSQQSAEQPQQAPDFSAQLQKTLQKFGATREAQAKAEYEQRMGEKAPEQTPEPAPKEPKPAEPEAQAKPSEAEAEPPEPNRKRGPDYTAKSFKSWIEDNPQKAAKLFREVGAGVTEENNDPFVRLQEKRRGARKEIAEAQAKVDADRKKVEDLQAKVDAGAEAAMRQMQPAMDLLESMGKGDFAAIDVAWKKTTGHNFDDYIKLRARQGVTKVAASAEALRIKELEAENERLKAPKEEPKEEAKEPEPPPPAVDTKDIEADVPEEHGVRELANWEAKVQKVLEGSVEEDDDGNQRVTMLIEDAADQVLDAYREKLGLKKEKPEARPARKPAPARRAAPVVEDTTTDDDGKDPMEAFQARMQRALKRAAAQRGE